MPAAYQQMQSAFQAIHPELEDASRILGATRLRRCAQITAPLLRTSVIATWCFIFVGTIRELSAAIMLFTSETKVISVLIFDLNESGDLGAISVLGLIMLVVTFAVVVAGQPPAGLRRRQRAAAGQLHGRRASRRSPSPRQSGRSASPRVDAGASAGCAAREKCEELADRRRRPLHRRAQRGLRQGARSPAGTTTAPAPRSATRAR